MTEILQQGTRFPGPPIGPQVVDSPPGQHLVQFYDDDQILAAAVAEFLAKGLEAREALLVVATPGHVEMIEDTLSERGLDLSGARANGQLTVLDAADALDQFFDGEEPDWDRFLAEIGGAAARSIVASPSGRVRAYGEMVDLLCRRGLYRAALQLEEFWNRLQGQYPLSLLCAYVMGSFFSESQSADFRQVCERHDQVFPANEPRMDPEAQLRQISLLQQRALALETELLRRKEREEALRIARQQAEAASRAKDEFLAMLGHELRNPLSAIGSAVAVLERLRVDDLRGTRATQIIARQTQHLARLMDDLLDVGRVVTGKIILEPRAMDLLAAARRAVATLRAAGVTERHDVSVDGHPVWVTGDPTRLEQVVTNLVSNALKFTPAGGTIRVWVGVEGGEALLRVSDSGVGMSPELLPRIFDLFVQGDQPPERASGGLGIGLTLVRQLVELHGGRVEARSAGAGQGSVFTIRLPVARTTASDGADARQAGVAPCRILLVEDNADARDMLLALLTLDRHEVVTAADGPAGVDAALRLRPDVALVDIGLPGLNGYEVARRIRATESGRAIKLIALTGYGQSEDMRQAREAGFDLHLVKPVEPGRLDEALRALRPTDAQP